MTPNNYQRDTNPSHTHGTCSTRSEHKCYGKQVIEGLRMRDIRDCLHRAAFSSIRKAIDVEALAQNLGCEIEKVMGIFPNVEGLDSND